MRRSSVAWPAKWPAAGSLPSTSLRSASRTAPGRRSTTRSSSSPRGGASSSRKLPISKRSRERLMRLLRSCRKLLVLCSYRLSEKSASDSQDTCHSSHTHRVGPCCSVHC